MRLTNGAGAFKCSQHSSRTRSGRADLIGSSWIYTDRVLFVCCRPLVIGTAAWWKLRVPETNSFLCSLMSYMKVNLLSHWFRLPFSKEPHKCLICRYPGEWLHQCQLHWWIQEAECLHCYPRATSRIIWGLLEDGVGAAGCLCCHDDPSGGEVAGKKEGLITKINCLYFVDLCLSLPMMIG